MDVCINPEYFNISIKYLIVRTFYFFDTFTAYGTETQKSNNYINCNCRKDRSLNVEWP